MNKSAPPISIQTSRRLTVFVTKPVTTNSVRLYTLHYILLSRLLMFPSPSCDSLYPRCWWHPVAIAAVSCRTSNRMPISTVEPSHMRWPWRWPLDRWVVIFPGSKTGTGVADRGSHRWKGCHNSSSATLMLLIRPKVVLEDYSWDGIFSELWAMSNWVVSRYEMC